jgi:hypothetical protein
MTGKRQVIGVGLPLRLTVYDLQNSYVIAKEVKQSYKSEFRLLRLPVHYTQTGRFTSSQ